MSETQIYALADPRTGEIRYVGKSNCPAERLRGHIKDKLKNSAKREWIAELRTLELKPTIRVLETCPIERWEDREIFWISRLRSEGARLINSSHGGEGCDFQPERTKEAIRIALRLSPKKRASIERQKGVRFSEERVSAIKLALAVSPKQKAKKGRPLPQAWRDAIRAGRKKPGALAQLHRIQQARKGTHLSAEARQKLSHALKVSERAKSARIEDSKRKMGVPQHPAAAVALRKYHGLKRRFKSEGWSELDARRMASEAYSK